MTIVFFVMILFILISGVFIMLLNKDKQELVDYSRFLLCMAICSIVVFNGGWIGVVTYFTALFVLSLGVFFILNKIKTNLMFNKIYFLVLFVCVVFSYQFAAIQGDVFSVLEKIIGV